MDLFFFFTFNLYINIAMILGMKTHKTLPRPVSLIYTHIYVYVKETKKSPNLNHWKPKLCPVLFLWDFLVFLRVRGV